jgi:tetraacyldisaccharide 4'-kinase
MALADLLKDEFPLAFLSRGYGGALQGPARVVQETHSASDVGDEPLLLAAHAPAYIARKRIDGARLAASDGAKLIIMDDGFQNPTIAKDFSLLLLAADDLAGNGRVFPAGPLRESLDRAASGADAIVLVGDKPDDEVVGSFDRPVFHARLAVAEDAPASGDAIAFCGIARPQRFFRTLKDSGWKLKDEVSFPDHHSFTPAEIVSLKRRAKKSGAALITTEKDFVRLAPADREGVSFLPVAMQIDDAERLKALILEKLTAREAVR